MRAREEELIASYESLARTFLEKWHLTLENDFCAMTYYAWLEKLCGARELVAYPNLHNDLLCGQDGIESVTAVRTLLRLAEQVDADAGCSALFETEDDEYVWAKIQTNGCYRWLKKALEAYLLDFGDRGFEELKLEKLTFREEPAQLIALIRGYRRHELSIEQLEQQEQGIRRHAESFLRRQLQNPFRRALLRFVLRQTLSAVRNRENMRFARSRAFGLVRRLFRRMGELLAASGVLDSPFDLDYLTLDEVFGFVQGTAATRNLRALVELRKTEYTSFENEVPEDRIQTFGIPYLNLSCNSDPSHNTRGALSGTGCSSGIAEGVAKVVKDPRTKIQRPAYILVARWTDPSWGFLMISAKGIVIEKGSVLSHTAIIGRELGIPTIVGVKDATRRIRDRSWIRIDGSLGRVELKV